MCKTVSNPFRVTSSFCARLLGVVALVLWLGGCAASAISPAARDPKLPDRWQQQAGAETAPREAGWLAELESAELEQLVARAQDANYELARQRARVEELRQEVTVQGAELWPDASVEVGGSRSKVSGDDNDVYATVWQGSLALSWELDIWGKLSDRQRQAALNYQAALATLRAQQIELAAEVATGWFNTVANAQLETLLSQRLDNVSADLASLEQGYRRGLYEARDVYLSRNTVADSRANLASQQQAYQESRARLQLALARYPSGRGPALEGDLPELRPVTAAGTPALLLQRRPEIQSAWLALLAADAGLAAAHKERFPSFALAGRAGSSSAELGDLVDVGLSSWSIAGSLTQPLFQAGRLQAQEEQARARVIQAEQSYLDTVYNALAEVERLLSAESTLREQLQAQRESRQNANIAYELSLQQYGRGLVDYTTVLEAQRRAFDAQTAVITLHSQVIANRIDLYRALGGDFALPEAPTI